MIKMFYAVIMAFVCLSFFACSDEGLDVDSNVSKYLFTQPYIEWGSSKSKISSKMDDSVVLLNEDKTLCYQSNDETIAYGFKNDKLNTIVVVPKATLSLDEILLAFKGYTKLSQYDNLVYLDDNSNTIAEIENSNGFYTISWSQYGLEMANAVNLGLSVKWADVNLDIGYDDVAALSPENIQDHVTRYCNGLIGWGDPTGGKKSEVESDYPKISSISGTIYDVAKAKWGGKGELLPKVNSKNSSMPAYGLGKRGMVVMDIKSPAQAGIAFFFQPPGTEEAIHGIIAMKDIIGQVLCDQAQVRIHTF